MQRPWPSDGEADPVERPSHGHLPNLREKVKL
jgi:hypothetical protein